MKVASLLAVCLSLASSPPRIRPAMIVWDTGLVETITSTTLDGRRVWRVAHYPQDPSQSRGGDYDLYDLDRETLEPVRSVMQNENVRLELVFGAREVTLRRTTDTDTTIEHIPLNTAVKPEGPGLEAFVATLPLAEGYQLHYYIVDRWGGHEASRVKAVTLSVVERRRAIDEVLIRADDGSFQIKEDVLADGLHFPMRVEYTRDGKTYPASAVVSITTQ